MKIKRNIIYDESIKYYGYRDRVTYCRISIEKGHNNDILITKKFFKAGFYDEETTEGFCYRKYQLWGSFLSKRTKNEKYLDENEKKLIQGFIQHCENVIDNLQLDLKVETKRINKEISQFKKASNSLQVYDRGRKLKKIMKNV